jgi:effector-binding domain-containing protein
MTYDMETRELSAQTVISIREQVPQVDLPSFIGRSFGQLLGHVRLLSIPVMGEPFAIYHAFGIDAVDAEVGLPISGHVEATGRITTRLLPAMTVAETLHVGPYGELGGAYAALEAWIGDHGWTTVGPVSERYLVGPGPAVAPSGYRTMVSLAVARVPVLAS